MINGSYLYQFMRDVASPTVKSAIPPFLDYSPNIFLLLIVIKSIKRRINETEYKRPMVSTQGCM